MSRKAWWWEKDEGRVQSHAARSRQGKPPGGGSDNGGCMILALVLLTLPYLVHLVIS